MGQQNERFRKYAKAQFGELLTAVVKHPAMLVWLDADSNRAGHANENLARELMELFTLGIGHYSEADVQGGSRALTGWGVASKTYRFISNRHDEDEISLLGQRQRLNGDELLAVLLEHPATVRRLAWRLCTMFFGEAVVSDAAMDSLAAELHNRKLDIRWAVETILRSEAFYSSANLRARIPGPPEFIVGCVQALELCQPPPSTLLLAEWNNRMGQELFYPPNVGGWPEGRSWLSSRAVIARVNFISTLVAGGLWNLIQKPDLRKLAERHGKAGSLEQSIQWLCELMFGEAPPRIVNSAISAAHAKNENDQLTVALVALLSNPRPSLPERKTNMLSRRQFILRSSSLISLSPLVPTMLCRAAMAATAEADGKVLVVIQLDGGNDGINTVVPYGDDGYAKARVKLRLDTDKLHKLNDHVGLHPQMLVRESTVRRRPAGDRARRRLSESGSFALPQHAHLANGQHGRRGAQQLRLARPIARCDRDRQQSWRCRGNLCWPGSNSRGTLGAPGHSHRIVAYGGFDAAKPPHPGPLPGGEGEASGFDTKLRSRSRHGRRFRATVRQPPGAFGLRGGGAVSP